MIKAALTHERVRELLDYEPDTGSITWRVDRMSGEFRNVYSARAGDVAGNVHHSGYIHIMLDNRSYHAHRLAWLYAFGEWPRQHIDHIDGNKRNNRLGNLRDVAQVTNCANVHGHRTTNKVGLLGASQQGKWYRSEIRRNGVRTYLGLFETAEEAHKAYMAAHRKYQLAG